ncbi:SGNH/GDSL hydrolase family protein [Nocardia stercoris]|uniref:SGNH/GDSL hydrolase family protein n=1 Tax=Nocardia stercoris TaxID=2483361 RepID=A0A3M2L0J5_9NOCA|nr:SGNH/GDSL hydrolase family protein [Nocardia stercoris]RMI31202.1 SGNH/GDSL hydrolase family protein [Nocardia stercoris]
MSAPRFRRYVALGDSHTEGVGDGDDHTGVRGWADRLADHLAGVEPELTYANLAVRGRLAGQVRAEQLDAALALRPDLATVLAGVNDLLRGEFDADAVGAHLDAMFTALIAQGATVVTFTVPDITRVIPAARPLGGRIVALNRHLRAATRHGVVVADIASHGVVTDPRLWSTDRLHCSPLGHERIAAALAEALNVPGVDSSWSDPLQPPLPRRTALATVGGELRWATAFLAPWLGRRITGRSSGDGRSAKRPQLQPVRPALPFEAR